jgi:hypothetical protein
MSREDASAGVEHLQRAAKELIAAARLFLDAAEDLVDEPQVLSEVGATLRSVVNDLTRPLNRTSGDWFDGNGDHAPESDDPAETEVGASHPDPETKRSDPKERQKAHTRSNGSKNGSRVRRITVE